MEAEMSFRRILIAIDGGPISVQAARAGLDLALALKAETAVVHAVEPPVDFSGEIGFPAEVLLEAAKDDADKLIAALRRSVDLPASALSFLRVGHAAEVIGRVAGDWPADLIVIGSHGREGLGRILLGSVAEAVVRHAPCPVLVIRQAE
jgi:nucleotide-binding universal stress UspA family protein